MPLFVSKRTGEACDLNGCELAEAPCINLAALERWINQDSALIIHVRRKWVDQSREETVGVDRWIARSALPVVGSRSPAEMPSPLPFVPGHIARGESEDDFASRYELGTMLERLGLFLDCGS